MLIVVATTGHITAVCIVNVTCAHMHVDVDYRVSFNIVPRLYATLVR